MTDDVVPPAGVNPGPDWPRSPSVGWHSRFGGRLWRYDGTGVYAREHLKGYAPYRSQGQPEACREAWALFGPLILQASARHQVPPPLILAALVTASGPHRRSGFTGPATFRWDHMAIVRDVRPQIHGDYRAGPMQTRAAMARRLIVQLGLPYDFAEVAPAYLRQPDTPADHPLYDPATAIDIGAAEIRHQLPFSGGDPLLVAVMLAVDGITPSTANVWHINAPAHLFEVAARVYGDACAVLAEARVA